MVVEVVFALIYLVNCVRKNWLEWKQVQFRLLNRKSFISQEPKQLEGWSFAVNC